MKLFICLLFCLTASAAEWGLSTLSPHEAMNALVRLRAPLDRAPQDQELLGQAIMAYVALSLDTSWVNETDKLGLVAHWSVYASELARRREAARAGAPPVDLRTAAPELWLRLIYGDTRAVLAGIAAYPEEAASSTAMALRGAATRDWRMFDYQRAAGSDPFLAWAEYFAFEASNLADDEVPMKRARPLIGNYLTLQFMINGSWDETEPTHAVLADAAQILSSPSLDEAEAAAPLADLRRVWSVVVPEGADRQTQVQRLCDKIRRSRTIVTAQQLGSLWQMLSGLIDKPRGLSFSDGTHRLIGLGDAALDQRERLMSLVVSTHAQLARAERPAWRQQLEALLGRDHPLCLRLHLGWQGNGRDEADQPAAFQQLADGVLQDIAGPRRCSDYDHLYFASRLANQRPDLAEQIVTEFLRRRDPATPWVMAQRGWLATIALRARNLGNPDLRPVLLAAQAEDPYSATLAEACEGWDATQPLIALDQAQQVQTWVDDQISNTRLPWPPTQVSANLAIRWEGAFTANQEGRYRFELQADDGARILVDGAVVAACPGLHAPITCTGEIQLAAGPHTLAVEYYQGGGGVICQLRWQEPGAAAWSLMTGSVVHHGTERAPGWSATMHGFTSQAFVAAALRPAIARCETMPWRHLMVVRTAQTLISFGEHLEANRCLTLAMDNAGVASQRDKLAIDLIASLADDRAITVDLARVQHLFGTIKDLQIYNDGIFRYSYLRQILVKSAPVTSLLLGPGITWPKSDGAAFLHFHLLLAAGRLTELDAPAMAFANQFDSRGLGDYMANERSEVRVIQAITARLGKPVDLDQARKVLARTGGVIEHQLAIDVLAGRLSWQEAIGKADRYGDMLIYYRGIYRLTVGRHQDAVADLRQVVQNHPTWIESSTARVLADWLTHLDAPARAALPTAKPLDKPDPSDQEAAEPHNF